MNDDNNIEIFLPFEENDKPNAMERLKYLEPSRYFHYYMFYEKSTQRTCWLPEAYTQ